MNRPLTTDYNALLAEGIAHIESLSSAKWTDYNSHDPGITILEYLCFALTDLASRTDLPMTTLLAERRNNRSGLPLDLPRAHEILPCQPITIDDYRRLLIDIEGVRNAWLRTVDGDHYPICIDDDDAERVTFEVTEIPVKINGFYEVAVEFDKTVPDRDKPAILATARERLMASRNLCEDIAKVEEVLEEDIAICADLELQKAADVDKAMAEVLYALDEFVSPTLRFYTLNEMLTKGRRIEDVLRGPKLEHGFLEDADLTASRERDELRASDVVQVLMDIPQIAAVKKLLFTTRVDGKVQQMDVAALVKLTKGRALRFDLGNSRIMFFKEHVPYIGLDANVERHLTRIRQRHHQPPIQESDTRIADPAATDIDLERYTSIQHHFPLNYGIGVEGLADTASAERHVAAKQLKTFLLFFEQFLADYLAQLQNARKLLSSIPVERSLFTQSPDDVPGLAELVEDFEDVGDYHETVETFEARRNRFLDHLLARFGEQYREYGVLADSVYGNDAGAQLIKDKERILANIVGLNRDRATARDYTKPGNPYGMSGLERRLRVFLGFPTDLDLSVEQMEWFEIYEEDDADGISEYRFRLRNDDGDIMLSGTKKFLTEAECQAEMLQVSVYGLVASNYQIHETASGKFDFMLYSDKHDVIGRRIEYFETEAEAKAARDECVQFLQDKMPDDRLFVLEHVLVRPYLSDQIDPAVCYTIDNDERYLMPACDEGCTQDPYSFRISVIMPAWPERFTNMSFRSYFERFIREQTPAHIYAKVCWVSEEDMDEFARVYAIWKQLLAVRNEPGRMGAYLDALEQLLAVWRRLRNVYPQVHLHDCRIKEDITPTVLGHSALGASDGE